MSKRPTKFFRNDPFKQEMRRGVERYMELSTAHRPVRKAGGSQVKAVGAPIQEEGESGRPVAAVRLGRTEASAVRSELRGPAAARRISPDPSADLSGETNLPADAQDLSSLPSRVVGRVRDILDRSQEALRFGRSDDVDDFGLEKGYEDFVAPLFKLLYTNYFRVETEGLQHVPAEGRVLLVANHANWLVLDAAMIKVAVQLYHPAGREVRALVDRFVAHVPFLSGFLTRTGNLLACRENAERLLRKDEVVLLFPEGARGAAKPYYDRHRLRRFGRGGFIRTAISTGARIVPIATLGFEELHPVIANPKWLARLLTLPEAPVTPTFPLLGPLGLIPPPVKCFIEFGRPISFNGYEPEAADDDPLVHRLGEKVRLIIQDMFYRMLARRRSVWLG